ncbi:MAG TPA: glycosyltransferase family 2 protein [Gemmatimonadaceae bacterium]|nr:glycosyltransferase family 2 protein [Gemmatimonadaceae bacterium]
MRSPTSDTDQITYLIANYNHGAFIGDCIASLRAQTDSNWIALILDDASTDDSLERISELVDSERFQVITADRNNGYITALQRLITEATTDVVAILDPDDALEPAATGELLRAHRLNPAAGIVYSCFAEYDETLSIRKAIHGGPIPAGGTAIIDGPIGHILSFRRSVYMCTDGIDSEMLYAEDRDLVYKLEEVGDPIFIERVLYRYRTVAGSQTNDPVKRETGARNTRKARLAAIDRRGLRGIRRSFAKLAIESDYVAYSDRFPAPVQALASMTTSTAAAPWRLMSATDPR